MTRRSWHAPQIVSLVDPSVDEVIAVALNLVRGTRLTARGMRMAFLWASNQPEHIFLGPQRRKPLGEYRMAAVAAAYLLTGQSSLTVGRLFNRDHSTVLHATKKWG